MKTTTIIRSVLFTAICLLASKLPAGAQNLFPIAIENSNFLTYGPGYSNTNPPSSYANQSPVSYSPYPNGQIFNGWLNSSYNYQLFRVSSTTGGAQFNYPQTASLLSLNTVATVINKATYTLTVNLSTPALDAGNVTLTLFTGTQAADTTDYSNPANVKGGANPTSTPNPNPVFTSMTNIASTTISGLAIDGTPGDYSVSFTTTGGLNQSLVGQSFYVGITADNGYPAYGNQTIVNDVRLTELAVVPEPSTWALMLAGVVGLIAIGRRKLKA